MSSPNISFSNIPSSIRKPGRYTEYNTSLAIRSLPTVSNKIVILAQKTSSGIGTQDQPVRIFGEEDAILQCGTGSIGHLTAKALFTANKNADVTLCPLTDGTTAAAGSITITGTNGYVGSFDLWIANRYFNVSADSGDTSATLATSIYDAVKVDEANLPVTVSRDAGVLTFTARNAGSLGNQIAIAYQKNTMDSTVVVVQPTGGGADPTISSALTNLYPADYGIYVCTLPGATPMGLLKTHLNSISGPTESRPAIGVFADVGTQATFETLCGTTLNSERLTGAYHKYTKTTQNGHSLDYEIAGAYAAVIGSEEDPAMPLNGLPLVGIGPTNISNRLSRSQQESCLENGVTPLMVGPGEQVAVVRAITTYTTNSTGTDDPSLLDITTIKTLDYVRKAIETREALRFPRSKLSTRTPSKVYDQILDVLKQLEELEIVENVDANADGIIVEKDSVDNNRLNVLIPCDVVNGLMILANRIDLYL